jgi:hypothetical protein
MPVPSIIDASLSLRKLLSLLLLVFVTKGAVAKGPEPSARIPLEPLGFPTLPNQFLLSGSSMFTVNFVDDKHLLVTFSTKKLLKRLSDCPATDQDRIVDGVLLEIPTGKELARTSWRTHDRGQYLWNLGHGHFMLRTRDALTTFAPMINLAKGDAFQERPFITTERRIGGVLLSPDADLMILETMEPPPPSPDSIQPTAAVSPEEQRVRLETPVQVNFFTLTPRQGEDIGLREGDAFRTRVPGRIPANSAGYVTVLDQGQQHWAFDFRTYGGKVKELSPFESTCRPTPVLVSRGEFIAFGCHLSHTPQVLAGFNMRGEEMWEQNMPETYVAPTFDYAPRAGRFVLSRVLTHSSVVQGGDILMPELVSGQSIVVYQTDSGRQVLRIDASPVVRAGQNFALSPDGLSLAVVRGDAIEIHSLPPLTPKEREAVQKAEVSAPGDDGGSPGMLGDQGTASDAAAVRPAEAAPSPPAAPAVDAAANAPIASQSTPPAAPETAPPANTASGPLPDKPSPLAGDEKQTNTDEAPRKPPTLYNEPGEKPGEANQKSTPKQ